MLNMREADIYALQEVRCDKPYEPAEIQGYYPFWALCTTKPGYSGVCCLSRVKPLHAWPDLSYPSAGLDSQNAPLNPFDTEGRVLTLEFDSFFLVNCYLPNPHANLERDDFRIQWDERFKSYLSLLRGLKPVIVCGDFNATVDERDIHRDNLVIHSGIDDFTTTERENLNCILQSGFVDCFRAVHPDDKAAYSWWSYKRHDRERNHGWRLDYALVSDELRGKIIDCQMLSDVYGSDHCPVSLELGIDLPDSEGPDIQNINLPTNAPKLRQGTRISRWDKKELAHMWDTVDWKVVECKVARLQENLVTVADTRNRTEIEKAQRAIFDSLDARMLAVRHVCSASAGPGVDGVVWVQSHEKMRAALTLDIDKYHAMCDRLLRMRMKNGKERRVHIACYHDRAIQTLCEMALDPVAESWADRKSFAFRKGRTMVDMAHYVRDAFTHTPLFHADGTPIYDPEPPEWAAIADVRQCYEGISHQWLLDNIPLDQHVLQEFLNAGVLFGGSLFPTSEGVGVGLSISPTIANMTLDGLQKYLVRRMMPGSQEPDYASCNLIRYCDDIIVATRSYGEAKEILGYIAEFLKPRGLELSDTKTRIVNVSQGFDFMGRHYQKIDGIVHMTPSEEAIKRFEASLEEAIRCHTGSQRSLIIQLNRKLDGWASYHKSEESADAFREVDIHLTALLLQMCRCMHPHWTIEHIRDRYWFARSDGKWLFALSEDRTMYVHQLRDVVLTGHMRKKLNFNPYLHPKALEKRSEKRAITNAVGKYRSQWNQQGGNCWYCGLPILRDQSRMLERVDGSMPGKQEKKVYVHLGCHKRSIEVIDVDTVPDSANDTRSMLNDLYRDTRLPAQRYLPLNHYFRETVKREIELSFDEIEDILGQPLPAQASFKDFWDETGFGSISLCWLENGYEMAWIDPMARKAKFKRVFRNTSNINIPDVFLFARVPNQAKYEIEKFLRDMQAKYKL